MTLDKKFEPLIGILPTEIRLLLNRSDVIARIRVEDGDLRKNALGVLALGDYSFRHYKDGTFGLTSEEQLKLLDKAGIPYESIIKG